MDKDFSSLTWNCATPDTMVTVTLEDGVEKEVRFDSFDYLFNDNINNEWIRVYDKKWMAKTKKSRQTQIKAVMRRKHDGVVYHITLENGLEIKLTGDHTAIVMPQYKEKKVADLVIGDELPLADCEPEEFNPTSKIVSIVQEQYKGFVYDFETVNHLFTANKIITHNCLQIDLQKTFKDGFKIGNSFIREPQSIRAAASLGCIVLNECGT